MIVRAVLAALVVCLAVSCRTTAPAGEGRGAESQQSYDLRGKVESGLRYRTATTLTAPELTMRISAQGRSVELPMAMSGNEVQSTEVLAVNDGLPTRLRIVHEKDTVVTRVQMPGMPAQEERKEGSLHGQTELAELRDGAWKRTLEGGEPTADQLRDLGTAPYEDPTVYPTQMAVGGRWTITGPQLRRWLNFKNVLSTDGSVEMTFERVEKREGETVAVLSYTGTMTATTVEENNREMRLTLSPTGRIVRSLSTALDLEHEASGVMKMEFQGGQGEPGVAPAMSMAVVGPFTTKSTVTKL